VAATPIAKPTTPPAASAGNGGKIVVSVSDSPDLYESGNLVGGFVVRISRQPAVGGKVTVFYRTEPGTTSQFKAVTGQLTFKYGEPLQKTVVVTALADNPPPGGDTHDFEYFYLKIFDPAGADLGRSRGKALVYEQGIKPPTPG
jgi:hypothetical protein